MKLPVAGFALAVALLFVAGCANTAHQPYAASAYKPKTFALAVTVQGALQPTPLQYAAVQEKFVDEFWAQGWVLVTDLNLADYIVRVDFTPDPADPENSGKTAVVGVRDNPRKLLAGLTTVAPVTRYPTGFSYSSAFQPSLWGSGFAGGYGGYYGWGDSAYDGYSYSSPTLNPITPPVVTPKPPYRHHQPGQPDDCPPSRKADNPTFARHLPGDFARSRIQPTSDSVTPAFASSERGLRLGAWQTSPGNGSTRGGSGTSTSTGSDRNGSRGGWWQSRGDGTYARVDRTNSGPSDSSTSGSASSTGPSGDRNGGRGWWQSRGDGSSYARSDSGSNSSRSDSGSSRSDHSWSRSSSSGSDSGSSSWRSSHSSSSDSGSSGWRSGHSSSSDSGSSHSGGWSGSHSGSSSSSGGSYSSGGGSSHSSGSSSSSSSSSGSSGSSSSSSGSSSSQTTQPN
jgi:hypothetical protein